MFGRRDGTEKLNKQMRNGAFVFALVAAVVLFGAYMLITRTYSGVIKAPGDYSTTRLVLGAYSGTIECTGTVEPIHTYDVYQTTDATITDVLVKENDYVRRGTALYVAQDGQGVSTTVTAEATGIVRNLGVQAGISTDQIDMNNPVMQIVDQNVLVGIIQVPENAVSLIEVGQEANTSFTSAQGSVITGVITDISSEPSSKSTQDGQTAYDATLMFNDDSNLRVGTEIVAKVSIKDYGQVYYVPAAAVKVQDGLAYVDIVYAKGTIEEHQVQLLGTNDDGSKIIKGDVLADGTTIRADLGE